MRLFSFPRLRQEIEVWPLRQLVATPKTGRFIRGHRCSIRLFRPVDKAICGQLRSDLFQVVAPESDGSIVVPHQILKERNRDNRMRNYQCVMP